MGHRAEGWGVHRRAVAGARGLRPHGYSFRRSSRPAPHVPVGRLSRLSAAQGVPPDRGPSPWSAALPVRDREAGTMTTSSTEPYVLNIGPQHPSTHGVFRLRVVMDGERIIDADMVVGYLHRSLEKLAEERTYTQNIPFTDRMDYLSAMSNNLGYCMAVEKLAGIRVPERAQYLRVIMSELQRLANHSMAISASLSGPMIRASGVPYDVRKADPYAVYDRLDFAIPIGENGDSYDRFLVRMAELRESVKIVKQAVRGLPGGPYKVDVPLSV